MTVAKRVARPLLVVALVVAALLGGEAAAGATVFPPTHHGTNLGGVLAPGHPRRAPVGRAWGANVDAQIRQALKVDDGRQTPYAYSALAWGIAQRSAQGWRDTAATRYLHAALSQPVPYGLGYAWDAFGDHTVNPASTVYTITLPQVGQVVLDAYGHGQASYTDVTRIVELTLSQPRIAVSSGIGLAYSNSPYDVRPGYSVHNVNEAVAIYLQDVLDAGVTYRAPDVRSMIAGLNAFELASYNVALHGWTYRDGGSTAVQDPAHAGVGVLWGQRFYPATIGTATVKTVMTTDYGFALGSGVHASLAQFDCSDSRRWLPQYAQYMAVYTDFGSAAKTTPSMSQSAAACGAPVPVGGFAVTSRAVMRANAARITTRHYAPDNYGPTRSSVRP